jgi:hypothetical protein
MGPDDSAGTRLRRWTPLTFLLPRRYVEYDERWDAFDLLEWSRNDYEWTEDPWNGYRDFAQSPRETLRRGRGDCEDYALVAVSWAIARGRSGVGLGFCWEFPYPWPRHVVAFDDERVYSSGVVSRESVDEWAADSRYDLVVRRRLT